jgi:cytochrome c oxidase cbb3-type subunit III
MTCPMTCPILLIPIAGPGRLALTLSRSRALAISRAPSRAHSLAASLALALIRATTEQTRASRAHSLAASLALALALALALTACEREQRRFSGPAPGASPAVLEPQSSLVPGPPPLGGSPLDPSLPGYVETAYDISEGRALFKAFNCAGCHASGGGGGMGLPLIDDGWRYGSAPGDVAVSIVAGRPDGMPSYRGKLAQPQLYQLVAFVRALGGLVRTDAQSARDDHAQRTRSPILRDLAIPGPGRAVP